MNDTLQGLYPDTNTSTIVVDRLVQKIALGCVLSCLSIFTVCGNILVLYAIRTEKHLRTVSNLFILSLAVADLFVGLFVMPLSAATIIAGRWPFSSVICKMWLSIDYVARYLKRKRNSFDNRNCLKERTQVHTIFVFSTASIFNLVLLSLDRYWAVVYPLRYLQKRTRRRATIFILIVWFISLLWAPAVTLWSYIAPQHSDIIKKDECDTSFRSNKTFKTLTALVNFYLPLLTMILISCRIMVAIRSRSKMELGRRLSSNTQKQMKQDRTYTLSSIRNENQVNFKSDDIDGPPSSPTLRSNPLDPCIEEHPSNSNKNNSILTVTEPGQCFCSTCQTYDGNNNDSLWELQQSPIKKPSSLQKRLSFAQIKPISMIFSSGKNIKDKKSSLAEAAPKTITDNANTLKNSCSVSNNMKYSIIINSDKDVSSTKKRKASRRSISRTSSITSSFSDDFSETMRINSIKKQRKSTALEKLTLYVSKDKNPISF